MDEITRRVYECQKRNPTQGIWCEKVREDFNKVGLHMTDKHVAAMDSDTYKNMIKNNLTPYSSKVSACCLAFPKDLFTAELSRAPL